MAESDGRSNATEGLAAAFRLFRAHPAGLTKTELAQLSGLSRTSVNQRLEPLVATGLLAPLPPEASTGGRPAGRYVLGPRSGDVLVADVGASGVRAALCDATGRIVADRDVDIDVASGPVPVLEQVAELFTELLADDGRGAGSVVGIGLDVPGPVDHEQGRAVSPPIMTGWNNFDIPGFLEPRFNAPVLVEKDVNAMAIGEQRLAHPDVASLVFVKLGTGIGTGIVMRGELWAMMLDAKQTFDELIERLAPDAASRDDVLRNRIYQQLSSAVAGSQEFTAVAKLYDLDRSGRFDVLVLDTPPSRNALDFLDAPDRLTGFFEGGALKAFLAPTSLAARVIGAGTGVVFSVLRRLTGVDLLEDLGVFFRALGGLIDGFKERAQAVKALLGDPATTFLIVSSPEREPVEEAIFFRRKLADHGMPFGGLVVNRVHTLDGEGDPQGAALADVLGAALAAKVEAAYAEERALADRDAAAIERLRAETGDPDPVVVPQLAGDVHDIDGLVAVHRHLFAT